MSFWAHRKDKAGKSSLYTVSVPVQVLLLVLFMFVLLVIAWLR